MKQLSRLASRIFGVPLMVQPQKLDIILRVLGPRIGLFASSTDGEVVSPDAAPEDPMDHRTVPSHIAVIDIFGPLVKRQSGNALSGGPTTYSEIEEQFLAAEASPAIQGILLNIDSPGGEVGGAHELANLVFSERGRKPCFAVANDDAFSAAYLIGSSAERFYVSDSGGCGSIGTFALHVDQSALDQKLGLKYTYIKAGERKTDLNPHEPISDEAHAWLLAEINRLNEKFIAAVQRNRKLTPAQIRAQEAMCFFGPNCVAEGLADEVGAFQDAVNGLLARIGSPAPSPTVASATPANSRMEVQMDNNIVPQAEAAAANPPAEINQHEQPLNDGGKSQVSAGSSTPPPPKTEPAEQTGRDPIQQASESVWAGVIALAEMAELAGEPGLKLLPELIRGRTEEAAARKRLLEAKADACGPEISSRAPMSAEVDAETQYKTLAEARAKDQGIPYHVAYEQVVQERPEIYKQYLATRQAIHQK